VAHAYKIVAEYTREIVGAARVSIALLELNDVTNEQSLEIYGLDGKEGALKMGMKLPLQGTQVGHVVTSQQPVRVMDCANSSYVDCQKLAGMGVKACVDVPMISSGKVLGTLNTGVTDPAVYYPEVEYMLLQISSVLASAIEKERLLEQAVSARNQLLSEQHQYVVQLGQQHAGVDKGGSAADGQLSMEQEPECSHCRNRRLQGHCKKAPRNITD